MEDGEWHYMGCRWFVGCNGTVRVRWRWKRNCDSTTTIGTTFNLSQVKTFSEAKTPVFWLSENWTFNRFEINYLEWRKAHAKETSQLYTRGGNCYPQASPRRTGSPNTSPRPVNSSVPESGQKGELNNHNDRQTIEKP